MAGAELFEMPNLDVLYGDPADLDEAARVFGLLAEYCSTKAGAVRARTVEPVDVDRALRLERVCDGLYIRLPRWARW